ncbi:Ribonuclease H2 subunit A [Glycine soja]
MGLLSLQKCTATICILTYESPTNCVDEDANEIFGQEYLRRPNNNDINHLLQIGDSQYRRSDHRKPTIILEVVVSQDFSNNGPKNDINVVNQSHVFNDILQDDIYLDWTIFVKTIPMPQDIMLACIILHNMNVEDIRDTFNGNVNVDYDHIDNNITNVEGSRGAPLDFATYLQTRCVIHTRGIHQQFQANLMCKCLVESVPIPHQIAFIQRSPNQVLARGSQNIISLDFQHWSDLVGEPAKDAAEVESDNLDEDGGGSNNKNRLSNVGFTTSKRSEEIESSGKGRCRFFQARKLEHLTYVELYIIRISSLYNIFCIYTFLDGLDLKLGSGIPVLPNSPAHVIYWLFSLKIWRFQASENICSTMTGLMLVIFVCSTCCINRYNCCTSSSCFR